MGTKISLSEGACMPTRAHKTDAGYDLCANENVRIPPFGSVLVNTGVRMAIPSGYFGKIFSRSGLAVKRNIGVDAGVIDSGYRGEIKVLLRNYSSVQLNIFQGDKIAQLVILPYHVLDEMVVVDPSEFEKTDRGEAGFGSTG